jgi:hypothetical protein
MAVRDDLMNALLIVRDHGIPGLQKAVDSGAFVPAIAGAVLFPTLKALADKWSQEDQSE